jgi:hypothetical protein
MDHDVGEQVWFGDGLVVGYRFPETPQALSPRAAGGLVRRLRHPIATFQPGKQDQADLG